MRTSFNIGAALLLAVPAFAQDSCNHNNCYRAVLPSQSRAARIADCSSNLICTTTLTTVTSTSFSTVTPTTTTLSVTATPSTSTLSSTTTPSTATVTSTTSQSMVVITSTVTPSVVTTTVTTTAAPTFAKRAGILDRRQNGSLCPGKTLPAYANNCNGFAGYSSVCSCAGVTASTVTVSTGTSTVTSTTTLAQVTITASTTASGPVTTITTTAPTPTTTVTLTISSATTTTVTTLGSSTTTTTTTTTGSALPTPAACGNQGLAYAYYPDQQPAGLTDQNNAFDPTVVKMKQPTTQGATNYLLQSVAGQGFDPAFASDYVSGQPGTFFILQHRGYIYAPVTGSYTFAVSQVDDIVDTWLGGVARSGWDNFSTISKVFFNQQRGAGTFSIRLNAGTYTAVRILFKQARGDDTFQYTITAPNGQVIINSTPGSSASGYAVQFSCDGTSGPAFPPFGAET